MTWRCCGTAGWAGSSRRRTRPRRSGRSCARSPSGTCASSTRSPPGSCCSGLQRPGPLAAAGSRRISRRVRILVDIDDTIIEVHGHAKQGAGFGYSGVRGLNALLATLTATGAAPVILAQRLRKGSAAHPAAPSGWSRTRSRRPPAARRKISRSWSGWTRRSSADRPCGPPWPAAPTCPSRCG